MTEQPESRAYSAAWRAFTEEMHDKRYGNAETRDAWLWFLYGWIAKAKQADALRNRK